MGGEPFLEEKRGLKGFFMEPGVMNSFQGNNKKGGRKLQRNKKTITREIVLNRDDEAESCEESQSP